MASKALIGKTSPKGPKAANPTAAGGTGVRVSPGKGGAGRIGPDHCTSTRGHKNVTEGAYGHGK
jgi:hypothetical protein